MRQLLKRSYGSLFAVAATIVAAAYFGIVCFAIANAHCAGHGGVSSQLFPPYGITRPAQSISFSVVISRSTLLGIESRHECPMMHSGQFVEFFRPIFSSGGW